MGTVARSKKNTTALPRSGNRPSSTRTSNLKCSTEITGALVKAASASVMFPSLIAPHFRGFSRKLFSARCMIPCIAAMRDGPPRAPEADRGGDKPLFRGGQDRMLELDEFLAPGHGFRNQGCLSHHVNHHHPATDSGLFRGEAGL